MGHGFLLAKIQWGGGGVQKSRNSPPKIAPEMGLRTLLCLKIQWWGAELPTRGKPCGVLSKI
jgi:hypothetical protein